VLLCSLRATVAKFNIIITIGNVAIANALPPAARPVLFSFNYDAVPKFDVAEPLDLELNSTLNVMHLDSEQNLGEIE